MGTSLYPARGHAREHEHRIKAGLNTGDHIGIHPVADHNGLFGVYAEDTQAGAHHEGGSACR